MLKFIYTVTLFKNIQSTLSIGKLDDYNIDFSTLLDCNTTYVCANLNDINQNYSKIEESMVSNFAYEFVKVDVKYSDNNDYIYFSISFATNYKPLEFYESMIVRFDEYVDSLYINPLFVMLYKEIYEQACISLFVAHKIMYDLFIEYNNKKTKQNELDISINVICAINYLLRVSQKQNTNLLLMYPCAFSLNYNDNMLTFTFLNKCTNIIDTRNIIDIKLHIQNEILYNETYMITKPSIEKYIEYKKNTIKNQNDKLNIKNAFDLIKKSHSMNSIFQCMNTNIFCVDKNSMLKTGLSELEQQKLTELGFSYCVTDIYNLHLCSFFDFDECVNTVAIPSYTKLEEKFSNICIFYDLASIFCTKLFKICDQYVLATEIIFFYRYVQIHNNFLDKQRNSRKKEQYLKLCTKYKSELTTFLNKIQANLTRFIEDCDNTKNCENEKNDQIILEINQQNQKIQNDIKTIQQRYKQNIDTNENYTVYKHLENSNTKINTLKRKMDTVNMTYTMLLHQKEAEAAQINQYNNASDISKHNYTYKKLLSCCIDIKDIIFEIPNILTEIIISIQ
ncbi:hypothetical protein BDAP_000173 [Binucleata daphniae]